MYSPNAHIKLHSPNAQVMQLGGKNRPFWQCYLNVVKSRPIEQEKLPNLATLPALVL